MRDEVLKEVWATKDRIATRYRGNVKKFMDDLRTAHAASPLANARPRKPAAKTKRKSA
jgi:hypothetical protein